MLSFGCLVLPSPARSRAMPSTTPPERAAPSLQRRAYNIDGVGKTRKDSLGIFNLSGDATEQEVRTNYRKIAPIYHQDINCPASTGMSPNQAEEYFKLVNNAYEFLRLNALRLKHEVPKEGKHRINSSNTRYEYYYYYYYYYYVLYTKIRIFMKK